MRDPRERLRDVRSATTAIERYLHRPKKAFEGEGMLKVWFFRHPQVTAEARKGLATCVRALAFDFWRVP